MYPLHCGGPAAIVALSDAPMLILSMNPPENQSCTGRVEPTKPAVSRSPGGGAAGLMGEATCKPGISLRASGVWFD